MQHAFLKKQTHIIRFLAIFMLALTCWSCKTEYPSLPYNDIESLSIQDAAGKTLSASIVNDQIILYWPPLVEQPESITPTIKVSELATITPASGTAIQLQSDKPITYTVRAQDGSSKNYTLVFQYNQPLVQAKMNLLEGKYYLSYPKNEPISIRGENILLDEAQTKGYLVDKDGKETLLSFYAAPQASGVVFNTPEDLKPGIYHIKLISGRYTVLTDAFEVFLPTLYNVIKWQDMFYSGRKGGDLVLNINSREAYELYFKADFDHFIAVDNLNNEYSINNVVFDVAAMTITLSIPVSVKGDAINTLKMMDKNGKLLSEGDFNISLN